MTAITAFERWTFADELTPMRSTLIRGVRYDPKARLLEIVFKSGRVYQFVNVPPDVYAGLVDAESKGQYFLNKIRGIYPYWRLHRNPKGQA